MSELYFFRCSTKSRELERIPGARLSPKTKQLAKNFFYTNPVDQVPPNHFFGPGSHLEGMIPAHAIRTRPPTISPLVGRDMGKIDWDDETIVETKSRRADLYYDEFLTLTTQFEAIINAWPLSCLAESPNKCLMVRLRVKLGPDQRSGS